MEEVRFHATIGEDQVIRPPTGILIPGGEVEVTVRLVVPGPDTYPPDPDPTDPESMARARAWLDETLAKAGFARRGLTSGAAGNLDHHAQMSPPPSEPETDIMADTRALLLELAAEAEALSPDLPSDMAENHDHYAHGAPKR